MGQFIDVNQAKDLAAAIAAESRALPVRNTPHERVTLRGRQYSRRLGSVPPAFVLAVARELLASYGYREVPYELIASHRAAFQSLGEAELEELGQGIDSWGRWTPSPGPLAEASGGHRPATQD